ncbi:MAG TPA: TlpA disulfide reductase family protein [Pyrinomonadaceae bacterium]|jgi:peroxiredoxin
MKILHGFLLLCGFALAGLMMPLRAEAQQQPEVQKIPQEAVQIRLKGIDGKTYDVAEMRGNVLLVSFGATWCVPCKDEVVALEELKREYKDRPVKFMWVSIDSEDEISDKALGAYARKQKLSFPVLRDTLKLAYAQFTSRVRVPLVVFFDKEGRLSLPNHFGMSASMDLYKNTLRARLNKLLEERAGAQNAPAN